MPTPHHTAPPPDTVRLDKWLWAARFFKTRSAATDAVIGGKAMVNDNPAKPARLLTIGDTVTLRIPPFTWTVTVTALGERRGSAAVAATLYQESEASRAARERQAAQLRDAPGPIFMEGKPSKQDRRRLDKWRGR